MTTSLDRTPLFGGKERQEVWPGPLIDVDVHANVPALEALFPYLEPMWHQFILDRGWTGPPGLPITYPPGSLSSCRPEWKPSDGRPPASEYSLLQEQLLEPFQAERAVLNCYYSIDSLRHPDWAAALASAVNDWLIAEWLEKDPRLVASLVVPARSPADAAREIERVGGHPGFVQVLVPVRSDRLYGYRTWHPMYEAIQRHDLVMGLHWGGTTDSAPSPTGWPSWYIEEYSAELQVYTAQITSMVAEGVFQAFPELRVSVLEIGFAWLPTWAWRMDKEWKALRREIPWVTKPPTSLLREHMRFSVAPLDAGPTEQLAHVVEWLGSDELLMYASDYPHYHDDDLTSLLDVLDESAQAKLMAENARAWYRL
jgi:uncharacterized protein